MESRRFTVFLLTLLQFLGCSFALPRCTDSRAPFAPSSRSTFCPSNGTTCCNAADNSRLKRQFLSMNVADPSCASLLQSILCARCDPFSAELFTSESQSRKVPVLCNSTVSSQSTQSIQATKNFCEQVWNTCQNVSILNSPFVPSSQKQAGSVNSSTSTKLTELWPSQIAFCEAFGGASSDGLACFSGEPVTLNNTGVPIPPNGICLEKISNESFLNMVAHPDGSNRAFFSNQLGVTWLGTIPKQGSGGLLDLGEERPFLDLSDEVHSGGEFGFLGLAMHPKFTENGRFFVSYNCDKAKTPNCDGRCACNSDLNCDPSKLSPENGEQPCRYQSVIAEFTVNGSSSQPSMATKANPSEIRRVFTMGLPFTTHHGGQIIFGPKDGYLYFMMGDGGGNGDPYNFAQNKKSLLGKIMRLDIDRNPSSGEVDRQDLWGNYSIPLDNPYTNVKGLSAEIWASGFRNPWRCSFDSVRDSYFICADVGQDTYEEVNLIYKEGNYGWRVFEGYYPFIPSESPGGNTSSRSINPIFPITGYNRSDSNSNFDSASITGGYFYRSTTDPCLFGRYLYADLYAASMWSAIETPINSGDFISNKILFDCANDSPINCTIVQGSSFPSLGFIFSYGEDNDKDVYLLTSGGVYRIVQSSRCNYECKKASKPNESSPSPSPPARSVSSKRNMCTIFVFLVSIIALVLDFY